jgi:hypothetical protein
LGGLVTDGPGGASYALIRNDLPEEPEHPGGAHDGRFFYALARDLWHLDVASQSLDRPRYRAQRILFPALAWVVHPTGGGDGLVWTLFAVGVVGVFLGALATGAVSTELGGKPWVAVVFALWLGSVVSLRITTPDPLALGLALWAIYFSLRDRTVLACAAGVLAVLTREPIFLVLVGFAWWRRDRNGLLLAVVPAAVAGVWWAWLHLIDLPPGTDREIVEFTLPFAEWARTVRYWSEHEAETFGAIAMVGCLLLAAVALARRGLKHPLAWALIANVVLLTVLRAAPIGPVRNAARTSMPVVVLASLMLATPHWQAAIRWPTRSPRRPQQVPPTPSPARSPTG